MSAVKRTITFVDLDGNQVTEDWWFQIGKTDAIEMDVVHEFAQMSNPEEHYKNVVEGNDTRTMLRIWRELLFAAVAKRKGNRLVKGPDILEEFRYGGAYEQLYSDILEMDDAGASFFQQIVLPEFQSPVQKEGDHEPTDDELLAMSDEEFYRAAGTNKVEEMDKRFLPIAFRRKTAKAA